MKKPTIIFEFRISIDSSGKQRYSEEQIKEEIKSSNGNVVFSKGLLVRSKDGSVLGEFLIK